MFWAQRFEVLSTSDQPRKTTLSTQELDYVSGACLRRNLGVLKVIHNFHRFSYLLYYGV